jgi:farnesyl-diphosphate farnesyltransferase
LVPLEKRLDGLRQLREHILGSNGTALDFEEFTLCHVGSSEKSPSAAERILLQRAGEAVDLLKTFAPADRERIQEVLATIISGQELDLQRFGRARPGEIITLQTKAEFDDYTYRVAGCVGEFWTRMCRAHLFVETVLDEAQLLKDGIRFGRGLQMVNILRDVPADLRAGRCYLPGEALARHGLAARDLLDAANESKLRPLYNEFLDECHNHLAAGWNYTNALPQGCFRVRLACAWPVLIGVRTLQRLRTENVLDASRRIKIDRGDIRQVLWRTLASCWWPKAWRGLFQWAVAAG